VQWFRVRLALNLDCLAATQLLFAFDDGAIDAHLAGLDEELDAGSADLWDGMREVGIEAHVGGGRVGDEGANAVAVFGDAELGVFVEIEDGDWSFGFGFDSARGPVFGADGLAPVAFRQHVFRGHES
jgi:hypothetical protein